MTGDDGLAIVYGSQSTEPVDGAQLGSRGILTKLDVDPLAPVGDVNGDGLSDLISTLNSDRHFARVHFGAKRSPFGQHFDILAGGRMRTGFARVFAIPAGDINGDTEDLVYVVYGSRSRRPVVIGQKRRGGPITIRRGTAPAGRVIRHNRKTCNCTIYAVKAIGDVGGDRRDDLGIVLKQFGADDSAQITPRDLEGEGRLDIAYGSPSSRPVSIPATGGTSVTAVSWIDEPFALGDLTGDGRDDLLVAVASGKDYRLLAGGVLPRRTPTARLRVVLRNARLVEAPRPAGDVDGDCHADAVYSVFRTQGELSWAVLFGASPLAAFSVTAPGTQIMPITPRA